MTLSRDGAGSLKIAPLTSVPELCATANNERPPLCTTRHQHGGADQRMRHISRDTYRGRTPGRECIPCFSTHLQAHCITRAVKHRVLKWAFFVCGFFLGWTSGLYDDWLARCHYVINVIWRKTKCGRVSVLCFSNLALWTVC